MTMKLSLRRTKSRNKRYEAEMAKQDATANEGCEDKFEELLERIGDEEFLIEKIVTMVSIPCFFDKPHAMNDTRNDATTTK